MSPTKKLPARPEPRAPEVRPLAAAPRGPAPTYAAALAQAAGRKLLTACVAALPLGALVGTVSACGAAQPTQPAPYYLGEPRVPAAPEPPPSASSSSSALPAVEPIAPPAASAR